MSDQLEVKLIGAEIVRLSLQPGDVLVVSAQGRTTSREMIEDIRHVCQETFGVPTLVLHSGIELKALLNVSPAHQEIAEQLRNKRAEEEAERLREMLDAIAGKKEPVNA